LNASLERWLSFMEFIVVQSPASPSEAQMLFEFASVFLVVNQCLPSSVPGHLSQRNGR
jgi:hypothetical protein